MAIFERVRSTEQLAQNQNQHFASPLSHPLYVELKAITGQFFYYLILNFFLHGDNAP